VFDLSFRNIETEKVGAGGGWPKTKSLPRVFPGESTRLDLH
jgi:hypothetical protein